MKKEDAEKMESGDQPIDGKAIVAEYEGLKAAIVRDQEHTRRDGHLTIVRDSLYLPEGGDVVDKIRGGLVQWEDDYLYQPCTRVDNDPRTYDRISLERLIRVDGKERAAASIIFSETTEGGPDGNERLVVEKRERYTQQTGDGDVTGERYVKVASPSGEVLAHHHFRSSGPTPRQASPRA
jgi:hypothetical protein